MSASDTLDVPSIHEGEKPRVVSPSWLPFFLSQPSVLAPTFGGAGCGRRTNTRPKRLNGLFLFSRFNFERLDGPDSALGRQKDATKTPNLFNTVVLFVSDSYVRDFLPQQDDSVVIGTTKK